MQVDGFDWDDGNRAKCQKHGVSVGQIEALFLGSPGIFADPGHSFEEQRLRAIGRTSHGRWMFVAFTIRGATIRPISARYMHARR